MTEQQQDIAILRTLIWREPLENACGLSYGTSLHCHALERILASLEEK